MLPEIRKETMIFYKIVLYSDLVQAANGLYEGHRKKQNKTRKRIKLSKM